MSCDLSLFKALHCKKSYDPYCFGTCLDDSFDSSSAAAAEFMG